MDLPSIRRLAVRDITPNVLQALIDHGEDLVVERKRQPPSPPSFGAVAASFANTIGGLILLGVNDDKTIHGWDVPPRTDLQSHLGQLLRAQTDPLPPFVAEPVELDGKTVVVMRVFESADAPHLVRGTGALYTRTSSGKVPVDDQRMLLELAQRGRDAHRSAWGRLNEPLVRSGLLDPDQARAHSGDDTHTLQITFRATPVTVPPSFTRWSISRAGAAWASATAATIAPDAARTWAAQSPPAKLESSLDPQSRGIVARNVATHPFKGFSLCDSTAVADAAGRLGCALRRRYEPGYTSIPMRELEDVVSSMLQRVEKGLCDSEVVGRAVCRMNIYLPTQSGLVEQRREAQRLTWVDGEITSPADADELHEHLQTWMREYARSCGLERWEG